jgi:hypothetical protein
VGVSRWKVVFVEAKTPEGNRVVEARISDGVVGRIHPADGLYRFPRRARRALHESRDRHAPGRPPERTAPFLR